MDEVGDSPDKDTDAECSTVVLRVGLWWSLRDALSAFFVVPEVVDLEELVEMGSCLLESGFLKTTLRDLLVALCADVEVILGVGFVVGGIRNFIFKDGCAISAKSDRGSGIAYDDRYGDRRMSFLGKHQLTGTNRSACRNLVQESRFGKSVVLWECEKMLITQMLNRQCDSKPTR
jgi:hypothetical protein